MWLPGPRTTLSHDHTIRAPPCEQLNEKSVLQCLSVQSSNSSGRVIIVDIYTTVVKVCKNTGESFSNRHAAKRRLNWLKNYFRQELLSRALDVEIRLGLIDTAAGFCCLSPALKWNYQNTHFQWNHWEWVTSSDIVPSIGLSCLVRHGSRYGLDVARLTIIIGEYCERCSSQAVVCEMWFYNCSLWHLFHHVVERSCTQWCPAKPDFVVCGIELLALTISWSLKQSIWLWIEMAQVDL